MRKNRNFFFVGIVCLVCLCLLWLTTTSILAETQTDEPAPEQWTADVIHQRISEAASALQAARAAVTPDRAEQLRVDMKALESRVRNWVELEALYNDLLSEMQRRTQLHKDAAAIQEDINAFEQRGLLKKPPYTLSYYDDLLVEYESQQQQMETTAMALKAVQHSLAETRVRLRNAQDQFQRAYGAQSTLQSASGFWVKEGLQLDIQVADAMGRLQILREDNLQQQNQLATQRADLVHRQAEVVHHGLAYDANDLDLQINALDQKKEALEKGLALLQKKKKETDQQWLKIQESSQKAVYADDLTRLEDQLKGLVQWRQIYQAAIDQHEAMLRLADQQQNTWRQRNDLLKQAPDRTTLLQWFDQSQQRLAQIRRTLPIEQQRQNNLWQQTSKLEEAAKALDKTAKQSNSGGFVQALRRMAIYRLDYIGMLVAGQGLEERLSHELDLHLERKPIKYQAEKLWAQWRSIWNYQVWVIDDRPLTIRIILVALAILLVGVMATKVGVRRVAKRILTRPQIKATTAAAIEKLLLYLGYLLVVLFALRMVNIPLAAFAFLGGAVAIGLGFGAQNLINNFISGFIIMGEQPISIGDLIEVDGVLGEVEEIGARCTRIRTGDNIQILVPNSSFLEKNITNWTLSDRLIRAHVDVGVVYGSPVEQVEQLLLQACSKFDFIRKSPEPFVLFADFGDNALMFTTHFWINVQRVIERRRIESQLRFRIDALFRQAGIVIAFPQRDVHLDSTQPLKIQLLENAKVSKTVQKEE
jgi:potassium-dependent mechanosensitive channel